MVHALLVLSIALFAPLTFGAKADNFPVEGYLGEKELSGYSERWQPLVTQDPYLGRVEFSDERFLRDYFSTYIFREEKDYSDFLRSELPGGEMCSNADLGEHYDEIRFSYRLITLSYLLEAQWHMNQMADKMHLKKTCAFDVVEWAKTCHPKSEDMKKFIGRMIKYHPRYVESLPSDFGKKKWMESFRKGEFEWYSEYRVKDVCGIGCDEPALEGAFQKACGETQNALDLICNENDEVYGLSKQRDAYYLLGQSNIINTYNKKGEAMGCLRRFSEVMSLREVEYPGLKNLFLPLNGMLRAKHGERFLQGRVFFFGAGKEFEEQGLTDLYVEEQPLVVVKKEKPAPVVVKKEEPVVSKVEVKKPEPKKEEPKTAPSIVEIRTPQKSAFLQAAELRKSENLARAEVDMVKLKYDYVFSLNQMNNLSKRLKTFMKREALIEMMTYDKLGTSEGPVPLLFLKFMIDMEEHQGLWNLINVVGERFYVSNEIDANFNPKPELVQLVNDDSTGRRWQIYILKP
jgi:hypothetical protein